MVDTVQGQVQQRDAATKTNRGETVSVFCNQPHGMRLRLFKMRGMRELVMGGGSRDVEIAEPTGDEVIIAGVATEVGKLSRAPIVMGYAVTKGVSKEFWDEWLKQNKDAAYVKNNCIYAFKDHASGEDKAKDLENERSGLEPMALEGDPRRPQPRGSLISGVTTAQNG